MFQENFLDDDNFEMESEGHGEWDELATEQKQCLMLQKSKSKEMESLTRVRSDMQESNSGNYFQTYSNSHINHGKLSVSEPQEIQIMVT